MPRRFRRDFLSEQGEIRIRVEGPVPKEQQGLCDEGTLLRVTI